jgi:FAD:protein FMN transferase
LQYLYLMFELMKALGVLLFIAIAVPGFSQSKAIPIRIEGATMATTYTVVYFDSSERNFKHSIDSLLMEVNKGINNYDPTSSVSMFNKSATGITSSSPHFANLLTKSLEIAAGSGGCFDPTVAPLVNLWGFGPSMNVKPSSIKVDSILKFTGYKKVTLNDGKAVKSFSAVALDFGGIGQGYGVDAIAAFLDSKEIKNYLVELGGEGFASGKNLASSAPWRVGVIDPMSPKDEPRLLGYALVENRSFTTSGNYFNYRVIDGKRYGHTISPFTGMPIQQDLISVSVFAHDCATADAWATAFMVAGKQKALEFLEENPHLGAILITEREGKLEYFVSKNIREKVFLEFSHDH